MKIITPQLLESLNCEPARLKLFHTGIGFSKSACKLLSLNKGSKFVICQDEKDKLFYQDVADTHEGFEITAIPQKGGARCTQKGLLTFLYPSANFKFKYFIIGEFKDGLRQLTPEISIPPTVK